MSTGKSVYLSYIQLRCRLDSIAEDAELTDKSASDLIELAQYLKTSCEQAVEEYQQKLLEDEQFDGACHTISLFTLLCIVSSKKDDNMWHLTDFHVNEIFDESHIISHDEWSLP